MTRKQRRLTMIGGSLAVLAVAAALVLNAMRDSIVFFSTPTMAAEKQIPPGKRFRLGGLVQPGSLVRGDNLAVNFSIADGSATLPVAYKGILPDLFREGQGVVAEGVLDAAGVFKADTVLAKHDETYMPKDVADALKKQGHWKDDYGAKPGSAAVQRADQGGVAVIAEAGHYALVLALALALIQSTVPMVGARWGDHALMNVARSTALAQLLFVAASFAALVTLYIVSDFSVVNVFENSHSMKPLLYKITGVWGNHEGSMLLWVAILALFGGLVAAFGNNLPLSLRAHVLAVQGWIASAFYLFILVTSNPFLRIASPPIEGRDLNPVLQDIGLAVHPPMLYLGYVGFSISFSFAVAALIEGRIDAAWARWVRPWTLVAWIFLTLGIAMGSYWAYYELGWGGWWFWDPVENASLMPWLAGTALLHSAVVMEKRNALKVWTILLVDPDVLAVAARHLPGALGRADLGARVCDRSGARRVHPADPLPLHRRQPVAVRVARIGAEAGRAVRADLARRRAGAQQSVPHLGLRDRLHRHAVSAGAGGSDRRQDFGRRAVLQPDLRPPVRAADGRDAVRAAAGVEARRSARRGATADGSGHCGADRDRRAVGVDLGRSDARAARDRAGGVRHRRGACAISPNARRCSARRWRPRWPARADCRARPGGRRLRMPASAWP